MSTLKEAKQSLRRAITSRLEALSENDLAAQSQRGQSLIAELPTYRSAKRVGLYLSMPTAEARTDDLVRAALRDGKRVFVPYLFRVGSARDGVKKRKVMDMLRLRSRDEYEKLERDKWGIPTLGDDGIEGRENAMGGSGLSLAADGSATQEQTNNGQEGSGLDVLVLPGVAFDASMGRLGHGAGFYDTYLSRLSADGTRKRPFLIGLCLAEQLLPAGAIPVDDSDWRVDAVVVGDGRVVSLDEKRVSSEP